MRSNSISHLHACRVVAHLAFVVVGATLVAAAVASAQRPRPRAPQRPPGRDSVVPKPCLPTDTLVARMRNADQWSQEMTALARCDQPVLERWVRRFIEDPDQDVASRGLQNLALVRRSTAFTCGDVSTAAARFRATEKPVNVATTVLDAAKATRCSGDETLAIIDTLLNTFSATRSRYRAASAIPGREWKFPQPSQVRARTFVLRLLANPPRNTFPAYGPIIQYGISGVLLSLLDLPALRGDAAVGAALGQALFAREGFEQLDEQREYGDTATARILGAFRAQIAPVFERAYVRDVARPRTYPPSYYTLQVRLNWWAGTQQMFPLIIARHKRYTQLCRDNPSEGMAMGNVPDYTLEYRELTVLPLLYISEPWSSPELSAYLKELIARESDPCVNKGVVARVRQLEK